ncbi:hypothetical protein NQZ68_001555 [Dissostichus eleginoides]|nr:hypothetical protein NQZ68_001555 [Dissostichus eleginoides]
MAGTHAPVTLFKLALCKVPPYIQLMDAHNEPQWPCNDGSGALGEKLYRQTRMQLQPVMLTAGEKNVLIMYKEAVCEHDTKWINAAAAKDLFKPSSRSHSLRQNPKLGATDSENEKRNDGKKGHIDFLG